MKKVLLMFVFACMGLAAFAQNYEKIQLLIVQRKSEDAKKEIDKILADPKIKDKDKVDAIYWNAAIYSMFFADSTLAAKYPGSDSLALIALNDYEQKDTSLKALKTNYSVTHDLDNLRTTGFMNGVKGFNNHNYDAAFKGFKLAYTMDEFMLKHNFLPKTFVDTNTILYAGYAAQNSGKLGEAVTYYKALADANIRIPDSKDFANNLYAYMMNYFMQNNDQANLKKYMPVVKKLYPEFKDQWEQMEMQNTTSNASITELLGKYKQEPAAGMTESKYVTYAETFAQPDKKELEKLDSVTQLGIKLAAAEAYTKAYNAHMANGGVEEVSMNKNGSGTQAPAANLTGIYAYNAGIIFYNVYDDLGQRYYEQRGEGAGLKAKRDETEKLQQQYADSVIVWFTNCYNILKVKADLDRREKNLIKNAVQDLANVYQWKEEKSKGVNPKDVDKYEALFKQFDAEADKYSK